MYLKIILQLTSHLSIFMVATRSGRRTGRLEDYAARLVDYNASRLQDIYTNDNTFDYNSQNEESSTFIAGYHIGHPHEHPGFYRDQDENHRHRFGRPNRNDTWIPGHYRRTPLF